MYLTLEGMQVYAEYSEFVINDGLTLAGLHQTYADGIGDIHRDFQTLGLHKQSVSFHHELHNRSRMRSRSAMD